MTENIELDRDQNRVQSNLGMYLDFITPGVVAGWSEADVKAAEAWYYENGGGAGYWNAPRDRPDPSTAPRCVVAAWAAQQELVASRERAEDEELASALREFIATSEARDAAEMRHRNAILRLREAHKPTDYRDDFGCPVAIDGRLVDWAVGAPGMPGLFAVRSLRKIE